MAKNTSCIAGKVCAFTVALLSALVLMSCRFQMDKVTHPSYQLGAVSLTELELQAGIRNGLLASSWVVVSEEPGRTVGKVESGGHSATVEIVYSISDYVINLIETSEGLGYDGEVVHKRYTFWVNRLNRNIQNQILELSSAKSTGGNAAEREGAPVSAPAVQTQGSPEGEPIVQDLDPNPDAEPPPAATSEAASPDTQAH